MQITDSEIKAVTKMSNIYELLFDHPWQHNYQGKWEKLIPVMKKSL
jgi:hypothetical protein